LGGNNAIYHAIAALNGPRSIKPKEEESMKKLVSLLTAALFAFSVTAVLAEETKKVEAATKPAAEKKEAKKKAAAAKKAVKKVVKDCEKKDGEAKQAAERKEVPKK
jgi:mannitol-specific phosphotransferase system IIBC component